MLYRLYALWYGRRFLPRGLRLCYNVNLVLFVVVVAFTLLIMIPVGSVTSAGVRLTYGERWLLVVPFNTTVLFGILYSCDGIIWRRRGARTPFFLSTTSSMVILGNLLTIIGSVVALIYALTRIRRYIYFDQEVDHYFDGNNARQASQTGGDGS
jgi:hypothetical protein